MNLLKQVEPLYKPRFRLPHRRGVHTTRRRDSLCRKTSAQATLQSHHEQSREDIIPIGESSSRAIGESPIG